MKAKFDVGDIAISVRTEGPHVLLAISSKAASSPLVLPLTPTVARAIASTIMGAAAETKPRPKAPDNE